MRAYSFALVTVAASLAPLAAAHGWIKQWSADSGVFEQAQNQSLPTTAFRSMAINQGWIGANFLNTGAITCGASTLPDDSPTDAPTGTFYSAANNSAGRTLEVAAGGAINLLISGPGPGQPWPHNQGNIMAYLGYCGSSPTACQNFDASTAPFFKILGDQFGIQQRLITTYDPANTGNHYSVNIPVVQTGSYIFRFELVTFGQSTTVQGLQDQYYPFCGQIYVKNGLSEANPYPTVKFPGAYHNGNINFQTVPGPDAIAFLNGTLVDPGMRAAAAALLNGSAPAKSSSSGATATSVKGGANRKHRPTVTVTVTDAQTTVTVTETVIGTQGSSATPLGKMVPVPTHKKDADSCTKHEVKEHHKHEKHTKHEKHGKHEKPVGKKAHHRHHTKKQRHHST